MPTGKLAALIIWFVGLSAVVGLTLWYGAGSVIEAMIGTGWAAVLVLIVRAISVGFAGIGWWLLFPAALRPSIWLCIGLRFVREGCNALLPLAQVGGEFIGARCMALRGVRGTLAAASVIVDLLVAAGSQLIFAIIGLLLLVALGGNEALAWSIATGIGLAAVALGGFFFVQGSHSRLFVSKLLQAIAGGQEWRMFGAVEDLFARLDAFYAYRIGLVRSLLWHFGDWFVGAIEVYVVLRALGYQIDFSDAVLIESLIQAVRGAAFAIPGALGVQEGGLIVLCALFGVPAEAALALSLVKRIPDLILGLPGVIAWQAMEGWRFVAGRQAQGQRERI
jgi:putative membrane protein